MFVGTERRTLDDKWRVTVPNKLFVHSFEGDRENLYFAPADQGLILFTSEYFHRLSEQLLKKSVTGNRDLRRRFFGSTYPKHRDKNGRIQIPEPLRKRCGFTLSDEIALVGTGPYLEVVNAGVLPAEEEPGGDMLSIFDEIDRAGEEA